ncbi:unnamed protein product [Aureobasidium pullulans]|nr:unnamed protein product [Aureobasidium pullulans]
MHFVSITGQHEDEALFEVAMSWHGPQTNRLLLPKIRSDYGTYPLLNLLLVSKEFSLKKMCNQSFFLEASARKKAPMMFSVDLVPRLILDVHGKVETKLRTLTSLWALARYSNNYLDLKLTFNGAIHVSERRMLSSTTYLQQLYAEIKSYQEQLRLAVSMSATSSRDPLARLGSHRVREIFVQARVLLISHAEALFDEPMHSNIQPTTSLHHHYQPASIKESVIDIPHPAQATMSEPPQKRRKTTAHLLPEQDTHQAAEPSLHDQAACTRSPFKEHPPHVPRGKIRRIELEFPETYVSDLESDLKTLECFWNLAKRIGDKFELRITCPSTEDNAEQSEVEAAALKTIFNDMRVYQARREAAGQNSGKLLAPFHTSFARSKKLPHQNHLLSLSQRSISTPMEAEKPYHYRPALPYAYTPAHYPQEQLATSERSPHVSIWPPRARAASSVLWRDWNVERWWYHDSVQGSRLISETVDEVSFLTSSLLVFSQKTTPLNLR